MRAELVEGWEILLDLGRDRRASTPDALYLEAALGEHGIRTLFYPWHPNQDVLTPLGATRPLQLLVESDRLHEAIALRDEVLAGRSESSDVVVPVDDTWIRRFDLAVVYRLVKARATTQGGAWTLGLWAIRTAFAAFAAWLIIAIVSAGASALRNVMRAF